MPRIYRVMKVENKLPWIAQSARALGIRPGDPNDGCDISVCADGHVEPKTGGMSVAPTWRQLPLHRIPRRLRNKGVAEATGKDCDACWAMHDGPFAPGALTQSLVLDVGAEDHGTVQPTARVLQEVYEAALAATRDEWQIDEN